MVANNLISVIFFIAFVHSFVGSSFHYADFLKCQIPKKEQAPTDNEAENRDWNREVRELPRGIWIFEKSGVAESDGYDPKRNEAQREKDKKANDRDVDNKGLDVQLRLEPEKRNASDRGNWTEHMHNVYPSDFLHDDFLSCPTAELPGARHS